MALGDDSPRERSDLAQRLGHVLWLGGGTGAGKTSIATALAEGEGLQPYYLDFHDARDHSERTHADRYPAMDAFRSMSMDERWVLRTPEEMARSVIASSRELMSMVIEDLLARPSDVPIIAEGPWLFPEYVASLLGYDEQGIWLTPTPQFRARALRARGWVTVEGTSDGDQARANRLARDGLLTDHVRRSAQALGLRTVEVDGTRSLAEMTALVAEHFAPVLRTLPAFAQSDPAEDRRVRRALVASFRPFIARCTRGHAVLDHVAARHQLAAHQMGLLNSAYLATGREPVSESALRDAVPYAARSRVGAEHWQPLVAAGLARELAGGWVLTASGLAAVEELYQEIWAEVARRTADPALVGRIGEVLERLSYAVPLTSRACFIREMWGDAPANTLVRLYRAVWELWIYRDVCFRAAWEADGYTGPQIDVLTQAWGGAGSVAEIAERLASKQDRDGVGANLGLLRARGDVETAGDAVTVTARGRAARDAVEARTDVAYFSGWPTGPRLQALSQDFAALLGALE